MDRTCDLCGVDISEETLRSSMHSDSTGRTWCGRCNYKNRPDIYIWIFGRDEKFPVTQELPATSEAKTAPISRPSWDDYYLGIAKAVSVRGDCIRRQHGAVIVKNHKIVSTGYNGSPIGSNDSCGATGMCPRNLDPNAKHSQGEYDLCWATHAEANAVLRASWEDMQGATIYITGLPCPGCSKLVASSGISRVVHIS